MNTQISAKFAALAVALIINGMMMGSVAYLFNGQLHQHAPIASLVHVARSLAQPAV